MGNRGSSSTDKQLRTVSSPYFNQLEALFDKLSHNGMSIHEGNFQEHFEGPAEGLSYVLFKKICKDSNIAMNGGNHPHPMEHHNKRSFIENAHNLLEQAFKVKDSTIRFYFELMVGQDGEKTLQDLKKLLRGACLYAITVIDPEADYEVADDDPIIKSLANSCVSKNATVCKDKFCTWALDFNPKVFSGLEAWLHERFTGHIQRGHFHMLPMPDMTISEHSFPVLTPSLLWYLCCVLPICFTRLEKSQSYSEHCDSLETDSSRLFTWNIIYDSNEHGLSLNRFKHKCLNYPSPTVTLVKFASGLLLALALDQPWRDSSDRFGGSYSCLLEILPECTSILETQNIFYLRESARSAPKGLLVGEGFPPKVKIESDLSSAVLFYKGSTTENISKIEMIAMTSHMVDELRQPDASINYQVWGCGGVLAAAAQKKQLDWEKKEIDKLRKVKRPGRWDENPDKQILEMAGVHTSHNQRGDM